jgi:hypothetical protein
MSPMFAYLAGGQALGNSSEGASDEDGQQFVIDELKEQGESAQAQKALDEPPAKIDHEQHAALLEKFGIDPGQLAEKAAKKGLASL